jgi:hypothetical protein
LSPAAPRSTIGVLASQRTVGVSRKGAFSYTFTGSPAGAQARVSFISADAIRAVGGHRLNLGSTTVTLSGEATVTVTVRLARASFAILKRRHSLRVRATITIGAVTKSFIFTLRAPLR